jgi:hypothetical protein
MESAEPDHRDTKAQRTHRRGQMEVDESCEDGGRRGNSRSGNEVDGQAADCGGQGTSPGRLTVALVTYEVLAKDAAALPTLPALTSP